MNFQNFSLKRPNVCRMHRSFNENLHAGYATTLNDEMQCPCHLLKLPDNLKKKKDNNHIKNKSRDKNRKKKVNKKDGETYANVSCVKVNN